MDDPGKNVASRAASSVLRSRRIVAPLAGAVTNSTVVALAKKY
jgi:hypothetical protein